MLDQYDDELEWACRVDMCTQALHLVLAVESISAAAAVKKSGFSTTSGGHEAKHNHSPELMSCIETGGPA